jgi:hypothetical protein
MSLKQPTKIDVFNELVSPKGTFDYDRCCQLLGQDYDSFVQFCDAIKLIPDEIDTLSVKDFVDDRHGRKVIFEVSLNSGDKMQFET